MKFSGLKASLCGVVVLPLSACYSTIYDPWFDEDSVLYEDMQVVDATKEAPPADATYEKTENNIYVATPAEDKAGALGKGNQSTDKAFVAEPLDTVGTIAVEPDETAVKEKKSFVSAYIPYLKDSYRLDSKDRKALEETAKICKENNCKLRIISYAGKKNKNYETLPEKRALEIRQFLTKQGVAYENIKLQAEEDTNTGNFAEVLVEY